MSRAKKKKRRRVESVTVGSSAVQRSHEHLRFLALAFLSGTLWFLACADFDIWPLAWIAMVPCFFAIERASTLRRGILYGFATGIVASAGGFYWFILLLERFAHLPWIVAALFFVLLSAYQAVVFPLFAWAARSIRRRTSLPMSLVAPVVMVTFELCIPFIFPWYLAITQAWQIHVIQVADLTGPLGVTALLMLVNGALYDLILEGKKRYLSASLASGVLVLALGYGHLRIGQMESRMAEGARINVGVVQPNVGFDMKGFGRPEFRRKQLRDLHVRSRELEAAGADLIVWTETAYPFAIPRDRRRDVGDRIKSGFSVPLIIGAVTIEVGDDIERKWNTAIMLDREGNFTGHFDKIFLLVFGEYVPGAETFPWIRNFLPRASSQLIRGDRIVTFPFTHERREYRLGPTICYEDILTGIGRELGRRHPHLFVNLTNDSWFGDTSEPWEHLALSVFRSVEHRTFMVRAVNTGVSAFIDATGKVYAKTYAVDPTHDPVGADAILAPVVLLEGGHTLYAKIGDVFGYTSAVVMGFLWLVLPRFGPPRESRGFGGKI